MPLLKFRGVGPGGFFAFYKFLGLKQGCIPKTSLVGATEVFKKFVWWMGGLKQCFGPWTCVL